MNEKDARTQSHAWVRARDVCEHECRTHRRLRRKKIDSEWKWVFKSLPIQWPSPSDRSPLVTNEVFRFCLDDVRMQLHKRYECYSPNSPIPPEQRVHTREQEQKAKNKNKNENRMSDQKYNNETSAIRSDSSRSRQASKRVSWFSLWAAFSHFHFDFFSLSFSLLFLWKTIVRKRCIFI